MNRLQNEHTSSGLRKIPDLLGSIFRFYFPRGWSQYAVRWAATIFLATNAPGFINGLFPDSSAQPSHAAGSVAQSFREAQTRYAVEALCTTHELNGRDDRGHIITSAPPGSLITNSLLITDPITLGVLKEASEYPYGGWYHGTFPNGVRALFNGDFTEVGGC